MGYSGKVLCDICEAAIPAQKLLRMPYSIENGVRRYEKPVCDAHECQRLFERKASIPEYLFRKQVEFHRSVIQGRTQACEEYKAKIAAKQSTQNDENREIALQMVVAESLDPTEFPVLALPTGPDKVSELTESRIAKYRKHLDTIVEKAFSVDAQEQIVTEAVPPSFKRHAKMEERKKKHQDIGVLNDQFCTTCKGGCCVSGNDHAYLSENTILRIRRANPDLEATDIVALYLDALDVNVMSSSCINHTAVGCALNRDLRSDICNQFFCEHIHAFSEQMIEDKSIVRGAIVVNRSQNLWDSENADESEIVATLVVTPQRIKVVNLD
ncbi:hypothetical protein [Oleiphilus messinensis]|uniref:hypothetical protein n=1 Tax=Oleiphilus messinensis TaxID=141451 RepID=UPI0012F9FBF5|nr:hypothetical protein [Oleiphilus messinensis]